MKTESYELHVAGCTRALPIMPLNEKLSIAAFICLGDVELVEHCAEALAKKIPSETEVILTAETKGIPIAAATARHLGMTHYVVARKSLKAYMKNPLCVDDESITTFGKQRLYLHEADVLRLRNRRVLILDDVISTGGSLSALEKLVELAKGSVIGKAAILAEGNAIKRDDIIYLEKLPLFHPMTGELL